MNETFKTAAGTTLPLMNLRGKAYLQVMHRLVWFREEHPDWAIETSIEVQAQPDRCIGRAVIKDKDRLVMATAHKMEYKEDFGDFIEKAETGAIGRALALCGYGTQFTDDLDEGARLVDAPEPKSHKPPAIIVAKKTAPLAERNTGLNGVADDFFDNT